MRIGIIGTGAMAAALGAHWARAGHELLIGGRSPAKAAELARRLGGRPGAPAEAALHGDAALLAVGFDAVAEVLADAGAAAGALRGRVLIDCTNALGPGFLLTTGTGPGAARTIAAATGARVVKAFNHSAEAVWRLDPPVFPDGPLAVPLCGDDADALELVSTLVLDTGCVPLRAGGLDRADQLEAMTAFLIGLWKTGQDPRAMLPPYAAITA
ncbi:NADPH-dependent F420 reductase [Streptomyces corynorhini]|uniref:NADP oxidoreductase n=1 Tax=Streptomyces corynorhini TaxID=2282652 RepID=A0A370B383_9ACTN|nr:NAD(P)-binding domain-containing protein [Streptomyces corynorhini]RDG34839.1 NADP oxidoreductase [Streptomyces corynorhini]